MTIAFLNPSGELGGAETALIDMVAALKQARPSWTLAVIAASDGPLLARVRDLAIPIAEPFPKALARLGEWGARWLEMARSAHRVSPDGTRRPYWLLRPLKPSPAAYRLPAPEE